MFGRSWILGLALVACSKSDPPPPASASPTTASAAPPAPPASVAPVAKRAPPGAKILDTSDWKDALPGTTLAITWTIDHTKAVPPIKKGSNLAKTVVPVELKLTLGGHSHTVPLEANAAKPEVSAACSRLTFFRAGDSVIFQLGGGRSGYVELWRSKTSQTEPTTNDALYAFDVPPRIKFAHEVVVVLPDGKRDAQKCSSAGL